MTTEWEMLDELHRRYNNRRYIQRGNGARWVCAEHVRNDAGFQAARTADFIAIDLWPSTGNALHGHEVKVSRSDWLAELRSPEKADPFLRLVDYWWLAVSDARIVRSGELPADWGLMVLGAGGLRIKTSAARLRADADGSLASHQTQPPLPRGFTASLLRAVAKTTTNRLMGPYNADT